MASDGGGAIGSTFFEVRLDDIPPEEPKPEKQKGTGGMSFNVDLGKFEWIQEFKFLQEFTFFWIRFLTAIDIIWTGLMTLI